MSSIVIPYKWMIIVILCLSWFFVCCSDHLLDSYSGTSVCVFKFCAIIFIYIVILIFLLLFCNIYCQVKLQLSNKNTGEVISGARNGDCVLHVVQLAPNWKQQFQQITALCCTTESNICCLLLCFHCGFGGDCGPVANLQWEGLMLESNISSLRWELRIPAQQWQTRLHAH